jgi:hypothetical protein
LTTPRVSRFTIARGTAASGSTRQSHATPDRAPGAAELTFATRGSRAFVGPLLAAAGLPAGLRIDSLSTLRVRT